MTRVTGLTLMATEAMGAEIVNFSPAVMANMR